MHIPHTRPGVWPVDISSSRFASLVRRESPASCRVALLGLPDDLGIQLNAGRVGASQGPWAFRAALARYGVADPLGWSWPLVFDAGDVVPAEGSDERALKETHARVSLATQAILAAGFFPIAIGGGHDLTLPFVGAVAAHERRTRASASFSGVYFDAHLDVRDVPGSGMPFRRLIEDFNVEPLSILGMNGMVNSGDHLRWFSNHHGLVAGKRLDGRGVPQTVQVDPFKAGFVSLDLDVFDQSHAPGVSATNPAGLRPADVVPQLLQIAQQPWVRCFDIMELSPAHDEPGPEQGRTARLAAHLFLTFLAGLSRRFQNGA
jgi:arginase family enzyme